MVIHPDISACSIVLAGQFNPSIFHPSWLHSKGIEYKDPSPDDDLLSHRDVSTFTIDTRSYIIRTDRFQLETRSLPWITILDITAKIFGEYLTHTPITAVGINRTVHFKLPTMCSRIKLGRQLAPLEPWGNFGIDMDTEDINLTGGLQRLRA